MENLGGVSFFCPKTVLGCEGRLSAAQYLAGFTALGLSFEPGNQAPLLIPLTCLLLLLHSIPPLWPNQQPQVQREPSYDYGTSLCLSIAKVSGHADIGLVLPWVWPRNKSAIKLGLHISGNFCRLISRRGQYDWKEKVTRTECARLVLEYSTCISFAHSLYPPRPGSPSIPTIPIDHTARTVHTLLYPHHRHHRRQPPQHHLHLTSPLTSCTIVFFSTPSPPPAPPPPPSPPGLLCAPGLWLPPESSRIAYEWMWYFLFLMR